MPTVLWSHFIPVTSCQEIHLSVSFQTHQPSSPFLFRTFNFHYQHPFRGEFLFLKIAVHKNPSSNSAKLFSQHLFSSSIHLFLFIERDIFGSQIQVWEPVDRRVGCLTGRSTRPQSVPFQNSRPQLVCHLRLRGGGDGALPYGEYKYI